MRGFDKQGLFRTPIQFNRRWEDNNGPECCDPYSETSEANREQEQRVSASNCVRQATPEQLAEGRAWLAQFGPSQIAREAIKKERKLNVVNIILTAALLVAIVGLIAAVNYGF